MTLAGLAEASGIPARTIRFYIARGLLDGPVKAGRDAEYTEEHVRRLARIQRLQASGRTLAEIAAHGAPIDVPATQWWQHAIGDDVVVYVKAGASPWRQKQIRAAIGEFAARVRQEEEEES